MHPCLRWYTAVALVWSAAATAGAAEIDPPTSVLHAIFNGRDLSGWRSSGGDCWRVEDRVLVGTSTADLTGSMLYTERAYGDVIVEFDVRFAGEIDSGIMLRQPEVQVQIGVSRSLKRDMTCSFYVGSYPESARAVRARDLLLVGDWNRIRVAARGDTFTVWLNGERVSTYSSARHGRPAPIGLQVHAGVPMKVEFRDIRAGEQ